MQKVQFNVNTSVHMIPDEVYEDFKHKMNEMKFKSFKDYQQRLLAGSEYQYVDVKIGDIIDVPEWYYKAHKNDKCNIGVSFSKYKDKSGKLMPFKTEEAVRHGDMDDPAATMKEVSRFTLVTEEMLMDMQKPRKKQHGSKTYT